MDTSTGSKPAEVGNRQDAPSTASAIPRKDLRNYEAGECYGDAVVMRRFDESDFCRLITVSLGANAHSLKWKSVTMELGEFIAPLVRHLEGDKDGPAYVLADMVAGQRLKTSVKTLTAIGLDIDTGMSPEEVDAAVTKQGCVAVRYTTHSHNKTKTEFKKDKIVKFIVDNGPGKNVEDDETIRWFLRESQQWDESIVKTATYAETVHETKGIMIVVAHAPMPKSRVIIPLEVPFDISKEAPLQADAMKKWAKVPMALAAAMGIPLDKTGTDPSRLFYFPRHAKDRPFSASIWGGPLYDWTKLQLEDAFEAMAQDLGKGKSKSVTTEGKELGRWSIKRAHGFQIADVIEAYVPDRLRGSASQGFNIECPFDEDHGNAMDPEDKACFIVNAGMGVSEVFTISCRHQSCSDKTNLDMLGKMIKDGWFDKDVLEDEQFSATVDDDRSTSDTGAQTLEAVIDGLLKNAPIARVKEVLLQIASAKLSPGECGLLFKRMKSKTTYPVKDLEKLFQAVVASTEADGDSGNVEGNSAAQKALLKFITEDGKIPFQFPPKDFGTFTLGMHAGRPYMYRGKSEPVPLCSPFYVVSGASMEDRDGSRGVRVALYNHDNKWATVLLPSSLLAQSSGSEALGRLFDAGLVAASQGKGFVMDYLGQCQPPCVQVLHRPGYRNGGFMLPTGTMLLTSAKVELADGVRLTCQEKAGTLAGWLGGAARLFSMPHAVPQQAMTLAGFAGVLTAATEDDALLFSLEGETTTSKSSSQMLSVAHYHSPKLGEGQFVSAHGTNNSHEIPLERGSGTVTAFDEVTKMDPKEQEEFAFIIQGGSAKRRQGQRGEERKTRTWKGGCVSFSAEQGMAQRMSSANVLQRAGLSARVIALPTSPSTRLTTEEFEAVTTMHQNFGHSGPKFIEGMKELGHFDDPSELKRKIYDLSDKLQGTENVQRRRAARQIAYLFAAGLIAQDLGLIPDAFDVEALATRVWEDAMASDLAPEDPALKGIKILCDNLISMKGGKVRSFEDKDEGYSECFAYFGAETNGKTVYVIRANKLVELAGGGVVKTALLKQLEEQGVLVQSTSKRERTWNNFPGLGKNQWVVLLASLTEEE